MLYTFSPPFLLFLKLGPLLCFGKQLEAPLFRVWRIKDLIHVFQTELKQR